MAEIRDSVLEEAVRLTRLARTVSPAEAQAYRDRRDDLLAGQGFRARVREEDGAVLVCYPEDWIDESGTVDPASIDDTDMAMEVRLSGRGTQGKYEDAEADNRAVAETVREQYGDRHGDNAVAFAEYMSNHYARRVETATATELEDFLTQYYPRNVWLDADRAAVLEESIGYLFDVVGQDVPLERIR